MTSIEQAQNIYELCVAAAQTGKAFTYGEVTHSLCYKDGVSGQAIRYGLELVLVACGMKGLPRLTSIVVNVSTGMPTPGTIGPKTDPVAEIERVFKQQEWPPVDEIDWEDVWRKRKKLSERYGTPGYWEQPRQEQRRLTREGKETRCRP
jgi:hypothetical protein